MADIYPKESAINIVTAEMGTVSLGDSMQSLGISSVSSTPSSVSNVLVDSIDSSRRPSSATSIIISPVSSSLQSRKPSLTHSTETKACLNEMSGSSESSIADDATQGHVRANRRQALARKIALQLAELPNDPALHCAYLDSLVEKDSETYTPAITAYLANHPDAIPDREIDEVTQRRKRYDEHETVTDRYGRVTRVDARQQRLFKGWTWEAEHPLTVAEVELGPKGENERGDDVRCAHCEKKERKQEVRQKALRGLGRLIGKSSLTKQKKMTLNSVPVVSEKLSSKISMEDEHAEQLERVPTAIAVAVR